MAEPVMRHPSSETEIFLRHLWPELPEGARLLVWSLTDKRSYWPETVTLAAVTAAQLGTKENVYIGVGASAQDYGGSHRCKSADIIAVPGIAGDFDLANPTRKSTNLFEARSEIHGFIDSLPLAPSLVVESGGGIQAWWLYKEPWKLETPEERNEAAAVSRGWSRFLISEVKKLGRSMDATHDLARVMRIPGTVNHKYGRKVELLSDDGPRYNPSDFETWREYRDDVEVEVGELVLLADAHPPWNKFHALIEFEPDFRITWERKRKPSSFPSGKNSPSEYSMSLATQAAMAGWEDQEIVDLVIAWRRQNGADLKLRQKWYSDTLKLAIRHRETEQTTQAIKTILDEAHDARPDAEVGETATTVPDLDDGERGKILGLIHQRTGLSVQRILRHGLDDDSLFSLVLASDAEIPLGGVKELMTWAVWHSVAMLHGRLQQRPKANAWTETLSGIQAIVETQEAGDASTKSGLLLWIDEFLQGAIETGGNAKERFEAMRNGDSFTEDGAFFFSLERFRTWIRLTKRENIHRRTLHFQIGQIGCKAKSLSARNGPEVCSKRYQIFDPRSVKW